MKNCDKSSEIGNRNSSESIGRDHEHPLSTGSDLPPLTNPSLWTMFLQCVWMGVLTAH